MVLISSNKNKEDEEFPRAKPNGCINTSTEKMYWNLMVVTKSVNYNINAIQT
jgi:hypothetical protein